MKVASTRYTFPKAPFPTHLRRIKWNRLTSASKSMTYERMILERNAWKDGREANLRTTADGAHGARLTRGYRLVKPEGGIMQEGSNNKVRKGKRIKKGKRGEREGKGECVEGGGRSNRKEEGEEGGQEGG
jgi:hypothetical protein